MKKENKVKPKFTRGSIVYIRDGENVKLVSIAKYRRFQNKFFYGVCDENNDTAWVFEDEILTKPETKDRRVKKTEDRPTA